MTLTGRLARLLLAGALAPIASACYEPAVRERVVLAFPADGTIRLVVDSSFKQGPGLPYDEREEIRRTLDLYTLRRDPWLRGLDRAGARDIVHERVGTEDRPERIHRQATLASVESIVDAMPDAVANVSLVTDEARGERSLRIVPIDVPASIRDNRRKLEREVETMSIALKRLGDAQCDLYDYLADRPGRRLALLEALVHPDAIERPVDPPETVLLERLGAAVEEMGGWTGVTEATKEPPAIGRLSFSAFDHDFCVSLTAAPVGTTGFVKDERSETGTWCVERREASDIVDRASPESEPPLSSVDERLAEGEEALLSLPFTCRRYDDEREAAARLWEEILPLTFYELRWSVRSPEGPMAPETPALPPAR